MKVKALKYNIVTGGILSVYNGSKPHLQIKTGQDYYPDKIIVDGEVVHRDISGVSDATHNMDIRDPDNPVPVEKATHPATIDKVIATVGEDVILSNLPAGSVVQQRGMGSFNRFTPSEDVVMAFDAPGIYTVEVGHELYISVTFKVEVST